MTKWKSTVDQDNDRSRLEWVRQVYGAARLTLPGDQGPRWSSCVRRKAINVGAGEVIEDRSAGQIKGGQRRLKFKECPMNIMTVFCY